MKQILLVRHGLPHEGHARHAGDPPLHADGRRHAARLARQLQREPITRIYSSPQRRALDTAQPLVRLLGLQPVVLDGLAEVDHGTDRYSSIETLKRGDPQRFAEFVASPARFFGKDPAVYRQGVQRALQTLLDDDAPCIAVFSHGMTIKTMLCAALGVEEGYARFLINHCSVSRISGDDMHRLRVDSLNETLCRPPAAPARPKETTA